MHKIEKKCQSHENLAGVIFMPVCILVRLEDARIMVQVRDAAPSVAQCFYLVSKRLKIDKTLVPTGQPEI
jgi:hypothetical protein